MFSETDLRPQSTLRDMGRTLFSSIDKAIYGLLGISYQLFFSVASADIFSTGVIVNFFQRIQVIIGIFVLFQLAMTVLKGIVDPDSFTDSKNGAANLFKRIATALVMLAMVVPINIPSASNEYEKQINNNGLLFGTLYSLQYRILNNNTIGKVVMGVKDNSESSNELVGMNDDNFKHSSDIFVSTVLKGFYRINLIPAEDRKEKNTNGKEDDQIRAYRVCKDIDQKIIDEYKKVDSDPGKIIDVVNVTCSADPALTGKSLISSIGEKLYAFTYMPVVSLIMGGIFVVILLGFCVEVAIRAIKLAILRLLAPIPIISYMDPKGSKDSSFDAWVKAVTSTYLDLFIRIASVYFVIYMIQQMLANGISTNSTGVLKTFTVLFIWIGLFYFAKEAPKFIKQVLGMKEDTGGLFSGVGKLLGIGAAGAGVVSGAISSGVAYGGKGVGGVAKGIGAGALGAIGGGFNAGKTLWKQDKPNAGAVMAANRARATKTYANAADESTPWGRFVAGAQNNLGLKNKYDKMEEQIKYYGASKDALSRITNAFDSNGDYKVQANDDFFAKLLETGSKKGHDYKITAKGLEDRDGQLVLARGQSYSLKDLNDRNNMFSSSTDGVMKDALDEAKKQAQSMRFEDLKEFADTPKGREQLVQKIQESALNGTNEWTQNDLIAYDAATTIYHVGTKYSDEPFFADFKGKSFDDRSEHGIKFGHYKKGASNAGRSAEQIKNSPGYFEAKANAARAEESNKSK
ncbi:MAG: hypothetical protein IJI58_01630 [Bacilli bacterium]|nr:hypothetical protein [Bacilli bacterium]